MSVEGIKHPTQCCGIDIPVDLETTAAAEIDLDDTALTPRATGLGLSARII
jgi:hypothetical protein